MSDILSTDIKYLPGIGPKRAELLQKELGVSSFSDMLHYFPFRWIDRSKVYPIREAVANNAYIQVRGKITKKATVGSGKGKKRFVATLTDATSSIELVFFSGLKWIDEKLKEGEEYIAFGKVSEFNGAVNMVHPEVETPQSAMNYGVGSMTGIYSITENSLIS